MRRTLVALLMGFLLGVLVWMLLPAKVQPIEMIPSRILGLVIADRLPYSLDFLPKTRLGEWLELDQESLQSGPESEWFRLLSENLDKAMLVVHSLERKESGAFRPHMTAFLKPAVNHSLFVENWIKQEVMEHFGVEGVALQEEGSTTVIRGPKGGQILYSSTEGSWLIVSNSESGWKDVQLVLADRAPSLREKKSFGEIRRQIGDEYDLLFYFSGEDDSVLPEFGYGVQVDGEEVVDTYYSFDETQLTTDR
jgi:hypothetical protein